MQDAFLYIAQNVTLQQWPLYRITVTTYQLDAAWSYTGFPVVRVTQKQKALRKVGGGGGGGH